MRDLSHNCYTRNGSLRGPIKEGVKCRTGGGRGLDPDPGSSSLPVSLIAVSGLAKEREQPVLLRLALPQDGLEHLGVLDMGKLAFAWEVQVL